MILVISRGMVEVGTG